MPGGGSWGRRPKGSWGLTLSGGRVLESTMVLCSRVLTLCYHILTVVPRWRELSLWCPWSTVVRTTLLLTFNWCGGRAEILTVPVWWWLAVVAGRSHRSALQSPLDRGRGLGWALSLGAFSLTSQLSPAGRIKARPCKGQTVTWPATPSLTFYQHSGLSSHGFPGQSATRQTSACWQYLVLTLTRTGLSTAVVLAITRSVVWQVWPVTRSLSTPQSPHPPTPSTEYIRGLQTVWSCAHHWTRWDREAGQDQEGVLSSQFSVLLLSIFRVENI